MQNYFFEVLKNKWLRRLIYGATFLLLVFIFRFSILKGMGNFLIANDEIKQSEVIFVLSGNATDRAPAAAKLFFDGDAKKIICTGGNKQNDLKIVGVDLFESDLSAMKLKQLNVPDSLITVVHSGTSTFEESRVALNFCQQNNIKSCIVVSSAFHTRRIKMVFEKLFETNGIRINISSAVPTEYDLNAWWKNEYGLLAVFNEYLKLVYYQLKY